jgi:hypothetical protein
MREWIAERPMLVRFVLFAVVLLGVGVGCYMWGKKSAPPAVVDTAENKLIHGLNVNSHTGDSTRPVAYIFEKIPVTRGEFGEYLITRFGAERVDFMVNRKIVEMECAKHRIVVTDEEVEKRFQEDLGMFGPTRLTRTEFVNSVLKRFGKTESEWREDVIRPKLWMEKLIVLQKGVVITDDDIQKAFEAKFGPQVECRMIAFDKDTAHAKMRVWENARKGAKEFIEEARKQPIPTLAASEGKVPAIHRHFGDKILEDVAFGLKVGDVSGLIELKDGSVVILLCERHISENKLASLSNERTRLRDEMYSMRMAQRIPEVFQQLRQAANVKVVLSDNALVPVSYTPPLPQVPQVVTPSGPKIEIPPPPTPGEVIVPKGVTPLPEPMPLPPLKIDPPPPMPVAPMPMPMPMPEVKK